ncbi:hypothetical protein AM609_09580 [Actinomyces sp. oral taxon 414]|nr:hypothetical protein AM609_09580 [Actinomyces sp. oral taxon 414]
MAAVRCAEADGVAGSGPAEPDLTEPLLPELDLRPEPARPEPFPPGPGLAAEPRGGVEGCDPDTI